MAIALIFTAMLLGALLIEPVASWLRLPFGTLLVLVGFGVSELLVGVGVDTGLRWHHFTDLILQVFLPVIVFQAAFNLELRQIIRNLVPILLLAIPVLLISTLAVGAVLYFGINHPTGFPWAVALLAGALLSPTDPSAVSALFERLGVAPRPRVLLEGESLFNDAIAIVVFVALLAIATTSTASVDIPAAAIQFLQAFFGGLIFGVLIGAIGVGLMFTFTGPIPCGIITVATIMFSVYLSEYVFHVSGVMAVLSAGLITGEANRRFCRIDFLAILWKFNAYIANALIFLLVGATITVGMFTSQWLAMAIGIGAVLIVRAVVVYLFMTPLRWVPGAYAVPYREQTLLFWGGLRGAVTLALALALPIEMEGWYTVQSVAYGVVLFGLVIQGMTMEPVVRLLKLTGTPSKSSNRSFISP